MTPTPQELKPSDYQAALDEFRRTPSWHAVSFMIRQAMIAALTRCAAEPVDAGELDAAIAELYAWRHTDGRGRIPLTLGQRTALLEAAKAHRASLSNVTSEDGNA